MHRMNRKLPSVQVVPVINPLTQPAFTLFVWGGQQLMVHTASQLHRGNVSRCITTST